MQKVPQTNSVVLSSWCYLLQPRNMYAQQRIHKLQAACTTEEAALTVYALQK